MKISSIVQIRPVGAEFFHVDEQMDGRTDRQTDKHDESHSRFSQYCKRS
jgi:hypothetical protein